MKRFPALALAAVTLVAAFAANPAAAQGPPAGSACTSRDEVLRVLAENFQEATIGRGLQANGTLLEVYASKSGTWTIVLSWPTGLSCIVSTGDAWMNVAVSPDGPVA